ncbi:sensor histidine kinase [Pontibacter sp. MBLB2868]|uniref:sensor histidine kinase n=1 Tax=Pontibacter sp. MBLB2868 TaxID=3451555 RepID=UPI003F7549FE
MDATKDCQEKLQQSQQDMEEFACIVSHDLKAPIRAITNLSSWIEEDLGEEISEDVKQNMGLLRNRSNRLEKMIEALLLYSRVSRHDLGTGTVDLEDMLGKLAQQYPTQLVLELEAPLPVFQTYAIKLGQVFENIISNSVKFSTVTPAVVKVSCNPVNEDFYEFKVSDNGPGIPQEVLGKIFNLFYTVSSKDTFDSVGAGLAITKKIVNFAGGSIYAASNNNESGLTVCFTWPKLVNNKA